VTATLQHAGTRLARIPPEWLGIVAVLVVFQLLPESGIVSGTYLPPMTEILSALWEELATAGFWSAVADTLKGWGIGLALATLIGIPLGILIGTNWVLYRATRTLIEFMRPIPSVALIPLAVLTYGTGLSMKIFLVTYASLWPLLFNTIYGVKNVDPVLVDTSRSFGIGRFPRLYRVTLPEALPYIATGLRISAATALILAVTAELVVGAPGLGQTIKVAQQGSAVPVMYAYIITAGILGWLLNIVFRAGEKRLLHWHASYRPVEPGA
jgi:ABC-type nitrate/sulfonate/bicarbonate transport system permease component